MALDGTLSTGSFTEPGSYLQCDYHTLNFAEPLHPVVGFADNLVFRAMRCRDDDSGDQLWDIYSQVRDLCGDVLRGGESLDSYLERLRYLNSYILEEHVHVDRKSVV